MRSLSRPVVIASCVAFLEIDGAGVGKKSGKKPGKGLRVYDSSRDVSSMFSVCPLLKGRAETVWRSGREGGAAAVDGAVREAFRLRISIGCQGEVRWFLRTEDKVWREDGTFRLFDRLSAMPGWLKVG